MKSKADFNQVFIENLRLPAIIGVRPVEQENLQDILISLTADIEISDASKHDDINKTVDYSEVCKALEEYISKTHFKLVETLSEKTADLLFEKFNIQSLQLKISKKPFDMKNVDAVGITIKRSRHPVT